MPGMGSGVWGLSSVRAFVRGIRQVSMQVLLLHKAGRGIGWLCKVRMAGRWAAGRAMLKTLGRCGVCMVRVVAMARNHSREIQRCESIPRSSQAGVQEPGAGGWSFRGSFLCVWWSAGMAVGA